MPAIPLQGDRSAWNSGSYPALHANDIDTSSSSIHHTLGSGSSQASPGNHIHSLSALSTGSSSASSVLTSNGSGSAVWQTIALDFLVNVYAPSPSDGYVLTWSQTTGSWVAYPAVEWRINTTQDTSLNDSDKTFTVPANYEWQILWLWAEYTSTASIGDRQLEVQIQDSGSNVMAQIQTGVTQGEGLTYKYLFGISVADMTTIRDDNYLTTPLPGGTFLSAGQKIRIWDNKAIDASSDDMVIRMQYAYRYLTVI